MRRAAGLIFVLSLAVRLFLLYGLHRYEINTSETMWIARSLAKTGRFADPYLIPTGPTAHSAPVYPAIASLFYRAFGVTPRAERARFAANAIAASAGYALLPAVAEGLGIGWVPGAVAAAAGAVVPLHYWPECVNDFENAWTGLFLEGAVLWLVRLCKRRPQGLVSGARAGGFWGAGMLLAPTVATVLAAFLAIAAWQRRLTWRWSVGLAAALVAVLTPWTVRNYVELGGLTFIRDDFGLELFVSNHDGATPAFDRNVSQPYWLETHPHRGIGPANEIRRDGELAFERRRLREAFDWIRGHPDQFARLTAGRVLRFWFPAVPRFLWAMWAVTLLAAIGWALMFRERRFAATVLGVTAMTYSLPFAVVQNTLRYQHPIWWVLLLLAIWPFQALRYTKRLRFTPNAIERPLPDRPLP